MTSASFYPERVNRFVWCIGKHQMYKKILCFLMVILALTTISVCAETKPSAWERYSEAGQKAFDEGQYKRAESNWQKALKEAEKAAKQPDQETAPPDKNQAVTLKKLGEMYLKQADYAQAATYLKRAKLCYEAMGIQDADLQADLTELTKNYRALEFRDLSDDTATTLAEAGTTEIALVKTDNGARIEINLPRSFRKTLDNPDVTEIGLDKKVSVDVQPGSNGDVKFANIKGVKLKAKLWVQLVDTLVKLNENLKPVVDVTAQKMGFSKTVTVDLPTELYAMVKIVTKRINDFISPAALANTKPQETSTPADNATSGTNDRLQEFPKDSGITMDQYREPQPAGLDPSETKSGDAGSK